MYLTAIEHLYNAAATALRLGKSCISLIFYKARLPGATGFFFTILQHLHA